MRRLLADWFNNKGNQAAGSDNRNRATEFYKQSAKADPTWSTPHFNLGLQAKFAANWQQSLEHNQRAVQLNPADEGAWWNLGIAATALSDWPQARLAWCNAGINVPEGEGEWTWPSPVVACTRINPTADGEVVWGQRIDPARIIIDNIPLPESNHRFRDIVLHDGAANGTRSWQDTEVPVFDELELWQPSPYTTFQVTADTEIDALAEICLNRDLGFEDWSSIRPLCKQCSEGNPGPHACSNTPGQHRLAVAAQSQSDVEQAIEEWQRKFPTARPAQIELLLPAPQSNAKIT